VAEDRHPGREPPHRAGLRHRRDRKGYLGAYVNTPAYTQGNQPDGPLGNVGGSHGGRGASGTELVYGAMKNPIEPGGGGGRYNTSSSYYGGDGGGLVRVQVLAGGFLVNDGGIYANGQSRTGSRGSGGAGGGVYLNTPRLLGAGLVQANGGAADSSYGNGGGGGRVAITGLTDPGAVSATYDTTHVITNVQARGGTGAGVEGGAGTVWVKFPGDVEGRLYVANNGYASADGSTPLVCLPESMVDGVDGTGVDDLDGNFRVDLYAGSKVNVNTTANATAGFGDDPIFTVVGNQSYRVDLDGDPSAQTSIGQTYRGVVVVDHVIIADGGHLDARGCDLWVKLGGDPVTTELDVDGQLYVQRADLGPIERITVANGGLIAAEGLIGSNDVAYPFDLTLDGGESELAAATLSALHATGGAQLTAVSLEVLGDALLDGGADVEISGDDLVATGALTVTDTGTTLTHAETGAGPAERHLNIVVDTLNLQNGGAIDVSGRGWRGGNNSHIPGYALLTSLEPPQSCGGSHGGRSHSGGCAIPTYDNLYHPVHNGTGGARQGSGYYGGDGGGSVSIVAGTAAHLNGPIAANGAPGQSGRGAGGAGGAIYVEAPVVDGTGPLQAIGGGGHNGYSYGGGGGMIAVIADTLTGPLGDTGVPGENAPWTVVSVYGGYGSGGNYAGSGTFYRRVGDTAGDLLVDNAEHNSHDGSTPLVFQGSGSVGVIGATQLSGSASFDTYGPMDGYHVNPKVGQGTPGLGDDAIYLVTGTSGAVLTFEGDPDPSTFTTAGVDQWSAYYLFDNLEVRGRAHLLADAEVRVLSGDIASEDASTFTLRGTLDVRTLDLNQVDTIALAINEHGELDVGEIARGDALDFPFVWILNDGALTKDTVDGASLTAGGAAVSVGAMHIRGDASFTSGSSLTVSDTLLRVDGFLTLTDLGTSVTHTTTGIGPEERRLRIETDTLSVLNQAAIDVSGRGWKGGDNSHVPGYALLNTLEPPQACGGSHGGQSYSGGCAIPTYDSLYHPVRNGTGGARQGSGYYGGNGGGSVEIVCASAAHLNGAIKANGNPGQSGRGAGGAGGSIYVEAPIIDGGGVLEANGGSGHNGYSYGGGGGMIALVASDSIIGVLGDTGVAGENAPWTVVSALGGYGSSSNYAGAGTFYRKVGAAPGDLLVDNADHKSHPGSTPLVFQGLGGFSAITATTLTASATFDIYGAMDDYLVNPKSGQGTTSLGDDHVYRVTDTSGPTLTFTGAPAPTTFATPGADQWTAFYLFDNLEVRGRAQVLADAEMRVVKGDIASEDTTSFRLRGRLDVRTLDLNGVATVELVSGGYADLVTDQIIQGDDDAYAFDWVLNGGTLAKDTLVGASLTASGASIDVGTMHILGDATLSNGTTLTVSQDLVQVDGFFSISDSGTSVTHASTGTGPERRLRIEADTLSVLNGGAIDVSGRGWSGGNNSHTSGYAPYATVEAPPACGGSHGGRSHSGGCAVPTYDSLYHPVHNGAGGARYSSGYNGGNGGGSVEIIAATGAHLNGVIKANGNNGGSGRGAGGAGGSIYVSAPIIDGSGTLQAVGGQGYNGYSYGGGGGMIALDASVAINGVLGDTGTAGENLPWTVVSVYGGYGSSGNYAGSGTFYRRVAGAAGDLLVDNAGHASADGSTPLVFQGSGGFSAIDATSLSAATTLDTYGPMDDYLVNPKIGQGTTTLGDDHVYRITSTAGPTVTFTGTPDPSGFADPQSDTWSAFYVFDNLEVRGRAKLQADAEVRVLSGDISSEDDETLRLRGRLDIRTLDVNAVALIELVDSYAELVPGTLVRGDATDYPFEWIVNGGTLAMDVIHGVSLVADGATLSADTVHITGDATLSGGTELTIAQDLLRVDGFLTLSDSGTSLTHTSTGSGPERHLRIETDTLSMLPGAAIDVTGRGWSGGNNSHTAGYALLSTLEPPPACGGSHGGSSHSGGCAIPTYDSLYHPVHNGSGGSRHSSGYNGGNGGGSVEIIAASAAHLNGTIKANGNNGGSGRGAGGAGGSIYVAAPVIDGEGALQAIGGQGYNGYSYGGGGGRIALEASTSINGPLGDTGVPGENVPWTLVSVYGGYGSGNNYAGSGTFFRRVGAAHGDLLVDNAGHQSFAGSTSLPFQGSGGFSVIGATSITAASPFDTYGAIDDYLINPKRGQGTVSLADDSVYRITATAGAVATFTGTPDPSTFATPGADTWSAHYVFDNVEVRGRAKLLADAEVRVLAGDIASEDATSLRLQGRLDVRTLDLTGVTTIELVTGAYGELEVETLIQGTSTDFGFAWLLNDGVLTKAVVEGASLDAAGATITADRVHITGDASFGAGTSVTIADDLIAVDGDLIITGSGTTVTHTNTGTGPERHLRIEADTVTMLDGGTIDVSGRGWSGGNNSHTAGYSLLSTLEPTPPCGGTHGGTSHSGSCAKPAWDSIYHPLHNGSGGARHSSGYNGGNGGGSVEILAVTAAHLNGVIKANGNNGGSSRGAGGAGGSIYVAAPIIDGAGTLQAIGGQGFNSYSYGGSGGMIALVASTGITGVLGDSGGVGDNQPWTVVSIYGGYGSGSNYAGSGTFYRRSGAAYGDLMVDNAGRNSFAASTPLPFQGSGSMSDLTATSLTGSAPFDTYGVVDDYLVNPKVGQGGASLGDDHVYRITATSGNEVTFTGTPSPTTFANPTTDQWSSHYRFENVEVRGGAHLAGDVELRITHGDIASGDDTTLAIAGLLNVRTLDLAGLASLVVPSGATLEATTLVGGAGAGVVDPSLDWSIGGTVTLPNITASDLDIDGVTLSTGDIVASGAVTLTDANATAETVTASVLTLDGTTTLTLTGDIVDVDGTLTVAGTSTLTHAKCSGATLYRLEIDATDVVVDPSAAIDVTGRGWPAERGTSTKAQSWPAGADTYAASYRTGGCHGGVGWVHTSGTACVPYGRFDEAVWPGSGGGRYDNSTTYYGGAGGGVIHVTASNAIVVNGAIRADGEYTSGGRGAGGGGGAIHLDAPNLAGTGVVSAMGGDAHTSYGGGGGGGGRVVITGYTAALAQGIFDATSPWDGITAAGGDSGGARVGGAGTIYMLPEGFTLGTLIIDNDGLTADADSTRVASVGSGTSTAVTATTLSDTTQTWYAPDYYVGTRFRADVAENATVTLDDDTVSRVDANTMLVLTSSTLPALSGGETYRGFCAVDQLEVRGGAQVLFEGDLIVYNGDAATAAQLAVEAGASLTVGDQLELDGVNQANITGTVTANPLVCTDCP